MPRRWSSSCARRAFHHPSFTVAHKPACNLFQLTAEENEDPARAIAPARVITNQAEQHMHQPDDEAYREKLCPAVSNPDTSEAEVPSAKKQRLWSLLCSTLVERLFEFQPIAALRDTLRGFILPPWTL